MTKCQRRRQKKKQAAAQAKDAQASNKSTSKGPQTPMETTPARAKISPAPSSHSAAMDQAANKPAVNDERPQNGEWMQDRASQRKAQKANRGLPSSAVLNTGKTQNTPSGTSTKLKAQIRSPQRLAANSHLKPVSSNTYSSAVGPAVGVANDIIVPLVGHKAPLKDLFQHFKEDHRQKQLDKLQSGASAFTAFRSVRGTPSLPPDCLSPLQHMLWNSWPPKLVCVAQTIPATLQQSSNTLM